MNMMKSETRDGMHIDWDAPIKMDDGLVLRADVFRPLRDGKYPVIMTYGPYAKGLDFEEGYKSQWTRLIQAVPDTLKGSSNKYQNWELVDPEKWVPDGYAIVRVDSRGAGRSPGVIDSWSAREARDFHDCIEWAGTQAWSNGKVGINGISYYAMNQWQVGTLQPKHLSAMCIWEGSSDYYRELCRHGGILCDFLGDWFNRQVLTVQNGVGDKGARSKVTGDTIAGPDTLTPEQLKKNRADVDGEALRRPLIDDYYRARMPDFSKIKTPLLSAGNWGGQGLHPRGNFEGFMRAASKDKWLEAHGGSHWAPFYTDYGVGLQKRFFDYFLKGKQNGWDKQPKVLLQVRHPGEKFVERAENEWPLARTQWTKMYLKIDREPTGDAMGVEGELIATPPSKETKVTYSASGSTKAGVASGSSLATTHGNVGRSGVSFTTSPLDKDMEVTGPLMMNLWVSSTSEDMDIFVSLRNIGPDGKDVNEIGQHGQPVPCVTKGWLRASHRKLDPKESKPYRPYHTHDEAQPLKPGVPVECDVEIWPTSIVVPKGYRLALSVRGKDYEYEGELSEFGKKFHYGTRGTGGMTHNDPDNRPADIYGGKVTLHCGGGRDAYLLLPVIPPKK